MGVSVGVRVRVGVRAGSELGSVVGLGLVAVLGIGVWDGKR